METTAAAKENAFATKRPGFAMKRGLERDEMRSFDAADIVIKHHAGTKVTSNL